MEKSSEPRESIKRKALQRQIEKFRNNMMNFSSHLQHFFSQVLQMCVYSSCFKIFIVVA